MKIQEQLRRSKGQGLTEGVCGALVVAMVFSLLVAFLVDGYLYCTCSAKLQLVADESAKVFRDNDYWNGAIRPSFQRNDEAQQRRKESVGNACANALANEVGLTKVSGLSGDVYLSHIHHTTVPHGDGRSSEFTNVTFTMPYFNLPYGFAGLFPGLLSLKASSVTSQTTEPPPAFIRLGYNLKANDDINPVNTTDVTQVCILPSYGFQTDPNTNNHIDPANLGLNKANADLVANQPDDRFCGWNGLNVALKPTGTEPVPRLVGNAPRQKNSSGGYTPYFGGTSD